MKFKTNTTDLIDFLRMKQKQPIASYFRKGSNKELLVEFQIVGQDYNQYIVMDNKEIVLKTPLLAEAVDKFNELP